LAVSYDDLPGALDDVLAHCGVSVGPDTRAAMHRAAERDAKAPTRRFTPDGAAKRRQADGATRAAAASLDGLARALADRSCPTRAGMR
jgi:hypothetical protein